MYSALMAAFCVFFFCQWLLIALLSQSIVRVGCAVLCIRSARSVYLPPVSCIRLDVSIFIFPSTRIYCNAMP